MSNTFPRRQEEGKRKERISRLLSPFAFFLISIPAIHPSLILPPLRGIFFGLSVRMAFHQQGVPAE